MYLVYYNFIIKVEYGRLWKKERDKGNDKIIISKNNFKKFTSSTKKVNVYCKVKYNLVPQTSHAFPIF